MTKTTKIKALRRITDAGHNIRRGATAEVKPVFADAWIARGWAEAVKAEKAEKTVGARS